MVAASAVLQLINLGPREMDLAINDLAGLESLHDLKARGAAETILGVVSQTRCMLQRLKTEPRWGGYLAADAATREVIGACGFKGGPADGTVEMAYFTFPRFEGRGYGTAMAKALLALAFQSGETVRVIAHTLPEKSASTRILEKVGLALKGEVTDPEDGRVWRWSTEK